MSSVSAGSSIPRPPGFGYRWSVVALLFFATTINYVDRQVLGILAPTLQRELAWSETDYGRIVSWFSLAYGFGLLGMGRFLDRIGVRKGFTIAIVTWSVAAMAHAAARTAAGFAVARALLGLGEAGNFPGALKAVSAWFPAKERAFAVGLFNAGSNAGAIIAPLTVPWIALHWGWQAAFLATGGVGFVWLLFWLALYREPDEQPRLSRAELEYIRGDAVTPAGAVPWRRLFSHRATWAFVVGKAMTDPVWLFYLFWLPKFLDAEWGVRLAGLAAPLIVIYLVADVGSIAGGWMSSALITQGWTVNAGRKAALLTAAVMVVPTVIAPIAPSMWIAIGIIALAAAAHQWWSCNLFTMVSDVFPKSAVASVIGIGGFAGAMSAMVMQRATGRLLDASTGNYGLIFGICGSAYLAALAIIHLLVPRIQASDPGALDTSLGAP